MNDIVLLSIGAGLAIVGGAISEEIRAWRGRSRERHAIKVCLADELREVESTIGIMHQVWENAATFHPRFVVDLLDNTSAYDTHRLRLFLIKESELRKEVNDFYKKLKDTAKKAGDKLGTLADTEDAKNEQRGFILGVYYGDVG